MLEEIRITLAGRHRRARRSSSGPGLTVITGETGAGKTMVVTALGPAARRPRRHRRGAHRRASRPGSRAWCAAEALAGVRGRGRRGRGRGRGRPASCWPATSPPRAAPGRSSAARRCRCPRWPSVAEPLVAVHGQSDQHRLLQARGPARGARPVRRARGRWRCATAYAAAARRAARPPSASSPRSSATARERAREADLLRFGLGEIEAVDPQPGEDVALAAEESRLGLRRHAAHGRRAGPRGALQRGGRPRRAGARSRRPARCSTASASTTPRPASWPTGSPRSPTCSPTSPPTWRPTPPGSTPTRPGWPRSPSGGRR